MKKLLSILLVLCVSLSFASCEAIDRVVDSITSTEPTDSSGHLLPVDTNEYVDLTPPDFIYHAAYGHLVSHYSYDVLLEDAQRELYDLLIDAVYHVTPEKDDKTGLYEISQVTLTSAALREAQVRTVIKAVYDDHPEIFWIAGTIGYLSTDSATVVQLYSNYSPDELSERIAQIAAVVSAFYAGLPAGLSDYELEKRVHDYIIDSCAYDAGVDVENIENNDADIYTVYGALCEGVAVCEGYGRSLQLLLNGLGIDCVCITGTSQDELHLWNAVLLDGSWCGVDTTWDDREEAYKRYLFFNLPDESMSLNHEPAPLFTQLSDEQINGLEGDYSAMTMNLFIPACKTADNEYYVLESPHLSDFDAVALKEALLDAALDMEDIFVFYIEPSLDFDSTLKLLFKESPQYFFVYVSEVNGSLYDYSVDDSNLSYTYYERNRVIAVELNYY